jgi:hypothetical protein
MLWIVLFLLADEFASWMCVPITPANKFKKWAVTLKVTLANYYSNSPVDEHDRFCQRIVGVGD